MQYAQKTETSWMILKGQLEINAHFKKQNTRLSPRNPKPQTHLNLPLCWATPAHAPHALRAALAWPVAGHQCCHCEDDGGDAEYHNIVVVKKWGWWWQWLGRRVKSALIKKRIWIADYYHGYLCPVSMQTISQRSASSVLLCATSGPYCLKRSVHRKGGTWKRSIQFRQARFKKKASSW